MILVNNINLPLNTNFDDLKPIIAKYLKVSISDISDVKLYRKSVDARHKNDVHFCCSVLVTLKTKENVILKIFKNASIYSEKKYNWKKAEKTSQHPPVIVGFGPAGMFATLTLARAGLKPIIIERGSCVEKRTKAVQSFFEGGTIDTECNVQFGEGGAGTFSDGKLTTGIKNPRCRVVLKTLVEKGAQDKILTDAKPHIGTDVLVDVVRNIRNEIISLGGEILFDTKLESITLNNNEIVSVTANGKEIPCKHLVLATGHSARDTYKMLLESGVEMVQKPFAVGVRIEHLQSDINKALYGDFADSPYLGSADYKLACHLENGRGVYTFCMCPGGDVINASSENGGIAVNGMSQSKRDGKNANSALLVGVEPEDFGSSDVLAGCRFQEKIEQAAFNVYGGKVPVNTVGSFVLGEKFEITDIKPTVKPYFEYSDFSEIFPDFIIESLKKGIIEFGKKIKGFDNKSAVLTAPETRSSAPVRILRNDMLESVSFKGIYPCGEGAGYAGGIVSAAVDGMTVAEKIIDVVNSI